MNEILSQEEIDALKDAVAQGKVETEADGGAAKAGKIESYDFFSRNLQLVSRLPGLKVFYSGFTSYFHTALASLTRQIVRTELSSVQQLNTAQVVRIGENLSCLCSARIPSVKQPMLFIMDSMLLLSFIDALCGGSGRPVSLEEKEELGPIEQRLVRKLAEEVVKCLEQAWQALSTVRMELQSIDYKPQVVTFLPAQEVVEVAVFQVMMEGVQGELTLGLPHGLIESFRAEFMMEHQEGDVQENGQWVQSLAQYIAQVEVSFSVDLARGELSVRDFFNLKAGDIIYLEPHPEDKLVVNVEGRPKFYGTAGTVRNTQAVRITSPIE